VSASGVSAGVTKFTTAMAGSEDALTDPSYAARVVVFGNPLVGKLCVDLVPRSVGRPMHGPEMKSTDETTGGGKTTAKAHARVLRATGRGPAQPEESALRFRNRLTRCSGAPPVLGHGSTAGTGSVVYSVLAGAIRSIPALISRDRARASVGSIFPDKTSDTS